MFLYSGFWGVAVQQGQALVFWCCGVEALSTCVPWAERKGAVRVQPLWPRGRK